MARCSRITLTSVITRTSGHCPSLVVRRGCPRASCCHTIISCPTYSKWGQDEGFIPHQIPLPSLRVSGEKRDQHYNERDCVSNHRRLDCLLNRWFRRRSKKTSKLLVTGLCDGNPPVTGDWWIVAYVTFHTCALNSSLDTCHLDLPGANELLVPWQIESAWPMPPPYRACKMQERSSSDFIILFLGVIFIRFGGIHLKLSNGSSPKIQYGTNWRLLTLIVLRTQKIK